MYTVITTKQNVGIVEIQTTLTSSALIALLHRSKDALNVLVPTICELAVPMILCVASVAYLDTCNEIALKRLHDYNKKKMASSNPH
jgi:hypothetical protein